MNRLILSGILVLGVFSPAAFAGSRYQYGPDGLPLPEARGCYFDRGHMYCGRYCYWEVNGSRYCHTRAWRAHSQAGAYAEPLPPRRRVRHRHPRAILK